MIGSPKARFLEDKSASKGVLEFVSSPNFQAAMDAAMLQLMEELADAKGPEERAANHSKLMGARAFRKKLEAVADKGKPKENREPPGLNYGAQ